MTQNPGEPVTRPTPTSVAAPAPFEEAGPVAHQPERTLPAALGSRRSLVAVAALAAAVVAATVVQRVAAQRRRGLRLR